MPVMSLSYNIHLSCVCLGYSMASPAVEALVSDTPFPGGAIRRTFGFSITKWMTEMIAQAQSAASTAGPAGALMGVSLSFMIDVI